MGMHVCVQARCGRCGERVVETLPVGHNVGRVYQLAPGKGDLFGDERSVGWLGRPVMEALRNPSDEVIKIRKEVFYQAERVILLNCCDYLYGHVLLKLLNAQRHLEDHPEYGLVVIVPELLRWAVPDGLAEIWTVNTPLRAGKKFYERFDHFVKREIERFDEVCLSRAHSHPQHFDIERFTRVEPYDLKHRDGNPRVTFILRADRLWMPVLSQRIARRTGLWPLLLKGQTRRVIAFFAELKRLLPSVRCAVAGAETDTRFPVWVEDFRTKTFDEDKEKTLCRLYAGSRLVVGIHGSSMLLPSGHAGMTLDLMPEDRWGNLAQDILYRESDPRAATYRYRFIPAQTGARAASIIALDMVNKFDDFAKSFCLS